MSSALEERILPLFGSRLLPFDAAAAESYAAIRIRAQKAARSIGAADSYIAATVAAHGFAIATRDTAPFEAAGVSAINPWEE